MQRGLLLWQMHGKNQKHGLCPKDTRVEEQQCKSIRAQYSCRALLRGSYIVNSRGVLWRFNRRRLHKLPG